MIKTLHNILKQDKERFRIPRSVQDIIPIKTIWNDGIFKVGNCFAKTFKFSDINYAMLSQADTKELFFKYSDLINSFECGSTYKLTIALKRYNLKALQDSILMPMHGDSMDKFREESNKRFMDEAVGAGNFQHIRYLTVSAYKNDIQQARNYFNRIGSELSAYLARLGSRCEEMDATEKLELIHNFFRPEEEAYFHFNAEDMARKGHDFKDYICPDCFEPGRDFFRMGDRYGRVIFLRDYANFIKDDIITELTDIGASMMLSIDIIPIPMDEAVREVENRLLGVETNIANWQRRQNNNNNFSATIPFDMEVQRSESKDFLNDLTNRDQRMMFGVLTVVVTADTKDELDSYTEMLLTIGRKRLCQFSTLKYQQLEGLNTVLPYGVRKIDAFRTLTTESAAVFMPFRVQEVFDKGGIYCGKNAISGNMIIVNKSNLMNGSALHFGVPGSGKSFGCKDEILQLILNTNDDILICDPEREYSMLGNFGAEIIRIAAGSPDHNFYDYADGIDRMSLARLTPIIGTDSWADNGHDRHGRLSTDAPYQTAYFSLLGNFAPEKRIFDSEWHILRCDPPVTTPDCLDMIMKQNVTCNLKAGTSWVCCPGINQKLDISSTPQVMLQIGLATASIREAIALYDAVARRPRPVAFFYSPHSRYRDNVDHVKSLLNLSEGAMFSGVSFRIIDERQLIDGQIAPETVPLVIVPRCPLPDPRSLDALKAYARLGGKVVFSGVFGALEAATAAKEAGGSHQPLSGRPEQIPAELGDLARAHGLYPEVEVTDADGRPAWGIQWHVAHTADGKAVLYAANLGKKPQSLVVKGARRLVDGNTGEGKAPALDLAVHDTFIGYLE